MSIQCHYREAFCRCAEQAYDSYMPKAKKTSKKSPASAKASAGRRPRVALIAADFNKSVVGPMVDKAKATVKALGCELGPVISVPGSMEVPLVLDAVLQRRDIDAVAVLGYIEKGQTQHGEVMGHVVYRSIIDLQLMYGKPVGLGIIGPGATLEQAQARNLTYGESAVAAAVRTLVCVEEANA